MGEHQSPLKGTLPVGGGLAGTGGPDGMGGFGRSFLIDSVGRNGANRPEDVLTASGFLHANGLLPGPTREATEEFHRGIEGAQSKLNDLSDGGLQIDGLVRPWGPTEILGQRAITSGRMRPPARSKPATPADAPRNPVADVDMPGDGAGHRAANTRRQQAQTTQTATANLLTGEHRTAAPVRTFQVPKRTNPATAASPAAPAPRQIDSRSTPSPDASSAPPFDPNDKAYQGHVQRLLDAGIVREDAEEFAKLGEEEVARLLEVANGTTPQGRHGWLIEMLLEGLRHASHAATKGKNPFEGAKPDGGIR